MGTSNSFLPRKSPIVRQNSRISFKSDYQESIPNNTININQVSEDELLLLPGITRQLAHNIVQYRQTNHGFKQIHEILQVDGMTVNIFKRIYADISIGSSLTHDKKEPINLNFASYEELCSVPGLTPNLATKIIQYRERKRRFRFVEDLLKVKGMDYIILATIRHRVTVAQQQIPQSMSDSPIMKFRPSQKRRISNATHAADTLSLASLLLETLPSELQTILISSPPQRPTSIHRDSKQKTFRFASWNLQELTNDKVQNPGVREVICRIILENNFSLIGIQEIGNLESLDFIVKELNNPTIPSIRNYSNRHHEKWKYTISDVAGRMGQGFEYLGFLYDASVGIELKQASLLPSKTYFTRLPFIAIFRIHHRFEFVFVNVHLKSRESNETATEETIDEAKALSALAQAMKDTIEQKHVVIFGDFNIAPTAPGYQALIKCNYSCVIQQNTNISLTTPQGSNCGDNIWLSAEAKALSSGNSGVIQDNLTSLWIPAGWAWGGLVSDHCPIWTEFNLS